METGNTALAEDNFKALIENRGADNSRGNDRSSQKYNFENEQKTTNTQIKTPSMADSETPMEQLDDSLPQKSKVISVSYVSPAVDDSEKIAEESSIPEGKYINDSNSNEYQDRRQFTSVLPGIILLLSFGVQLDSCIRELDLTTSLPKFFKKPSTSFYPFDSFASSDSSDSQRSEMTIFLNLIVWYIGAILGGFFGAMIISSSKKSSIYLSSGILMALSAMTMRSLDTSWTNLIFGFTYGLVQLTVIIHVSEIATKEMCRRILKIIVCLLFLSPFLSQFAHISSGNHWAFRAPNGLLAIQLFILGVIGSILTPILCNETSMYFLQQKQEEKALEQLAKLRGECQPSQNTKNMLEELKMKLKQGETTGKSIFNRVNLKPLFVVINAKLVNLILWNVPMTLIIMKLMKETVLQSEEFPHLILNLYVILQLVLGVIGLLVVSCLGEHNLFYKLSAASSIAVLWYLNQVSLSSTLLFECYLIVLVFGLITIGVTVSQWINTCELFSICRKPWSIAAASSIEYIVHIKLIAAYYFNSISEKTFWLIMFFGLILFSVNVLIVLPKLTKQSSKSAKDNVDNVASERVNMI